MTDIDTCDQQKVHSDNRLYTVITMFRLQGSVHSIKRLQQSGSSSV